MTCFAKIKAVLFIISLIISGYRISAEQRGSASQKVAGENSASFISDTSRNVIYVLDGLIDMSSDDDRNSVPQNLMAVDTTAIPLSPLDFLISTCANTGFYETGAWYSDGVGALPRFANYFPEELYSCCRPVKGKITSSVGYRPNRNRIHYGVDFSAEVGDTVVSSINGTVSKIAYERDGYGLFLFVRNSSGVESRYAHLLKVLVHQGDSISSGQPVALAGNSGLSPGPHLHFELRYNVEIVDASLFFR